MAEVDDANDLVSKNGGTVIESVYASYANRMKALANEARKSDLATKTIPYSPSANKIYDPQVKSLNAKLNIALKNAPLERNAQSLANAKVKMLKQANPNMDEAEEKKIKRLAIGEARARTGADKNDKIRLLPDEWEAIQAGAITNNKLVEILNKADLDEVKALATPRTNNPVMNTALTARAKSMLANGYTQSEVAGALGIPTSTLNSSLGREEG